MRSLEKAVESMKALGFDVVGSVFDDVKRNVRILFVCNGPYRVELIAPLDLSRPSPVDGILRKKSAGPYHLCYQVECLIKSIDKLQIGGAIIIEPPSWAGALESNVSFLFDRTLGVIELVERRS